RRQLDAYGALALARVRFAVDLDLHPHDAVIVLLESGELLLDVAAIPVGDLAVPSGDHYIHVNLPLRRRVGWSVKTASERENPGSPRVRRPQVDSIQRR